MGDTKDTVDDTNGMAGASGASDSGDATDPSDAGEVSDASEALTWCSVQPILAAKCQRCHASPASHGAPFALIDYSDSQVLDRKGRARFERIAEVVADQSMPSRSIILDPPVEPLSDEERATILSWCAQGGTPAKDGDCTSKP